MERLRDIIRLVREAYANNGPIKGTYALVLLLLFALAGKRK